MLVGGDYIVNHGQRIPLDDADPELLLRAWLTRCVGLPSEAQWEKAARGSDKRVWPWGGEFETGGCNSEEVELEETSPVGIFPRDRSLRWG